MVIVVRIKKSVARMLERERVCRVATVGTGGVPHVVPVCHVFDDGKIYFGTGKDAQKARNLQTRPRIAMIVDFYTDDWDALRGVMVQGSARLIARGSRFRRIRSLLYKKYPQYPSDAALDESDSMIVEVTPISISTWGVD